jgi:hypothetical protein
MTGELSVLIVTFYINAERYLDSFIGCMAILVCDLNTSTCHQ